MGRYDRSSFGEIFCAMKTLTLLFLLLLSEIAYGGAPQEYAGGGLLSEKVCRFFGISEKCLVGSPAFDTEIQKVLNKCSTIQSFVDICIDGSDKTKFSVRFVYLSRSMVVMWVIDDGDYIVVAKIVVEQSPEDKHLVYAGSSLFPLPAQSLLDEIEYDTGITLGPQQKGL